MFAHNIETVERLQPFVRDKRANYAQSLKVLAAAKRSGDGATIEAALARAEALRGASMAVNMAVSPSPSSEEED